MKNHPLSNIYGPQKSFSYKVEVRVFIFNGEIIGGISHPVGNGIGGSPYSLDGKTGLLNSHMIMAAQLEKF
ncbi:hypothetical protein [Mesobacillus sp.]|uniref:hypothetical protein n=1 Tax=Mesobacillus sp. TaxID=2675271 RepID=UPI0039F04A66